MEKIITDPGPSTGISHSDSFVILLKKYGIFSRRLQKRRHPAASSSGGRSCTGSGESGTGPGDMYASPGVLGIPWLFWPVGVSGALGLVSEEPGEPVSSIVVLIVNFTWPGCGCGDAGNTLVGMSTLLSPLMLAIGQQRSVDFPRLCPRIVRPLLLLPSGAHPASAIED